METKTMMIDSAEGLMTWCKSTGSGVRLQKRGAKILFDYLSGHGKMLSTNPEGELFINDDILTEKTTIDDVVDLVCEWNYEALSDTRERKENPVDFLDFCRSCTLEKTLEDHKYILNRVFQQTIYGKDVQTIAHNLAMEMMKEMHLVPIYDIPIADELGAYSKVSEQSEYDREERQHDEDSISDTLAGETETVTEDKDFVKAVISEAAMEHGKPDRNEAVMESEKPGMNEAVKTSVKTVFAAEDTKRDKAALTDPVMQAVNETRMADDLSEKTDRDEAVAATEVKEPNAEVIKMVQTAPIQRDIRLETAVNADVYAVPEHTKEQGRLR